MNDLHSLWIAVVVAAVTAGLRFLPFLIFRGDRGIPPFVAYLGRVLPFAVMTMLVVFCLKETAVLHAPYGIPELIAAALVIGLHRWKHNPLISIFAGTIVYMLLVQCVF